MSLTISEIKDLLTFGQELGLKQLQTEGLVAIYGERAVMPAQTFSTPGQPDPNDPVSITEYYANLGKGSLKR